MSFTVSSEESVFTLDREQFPRGFIIGAASSAFQVEGASNEGGRTPSIWDTYCEKKGWVLGKAIDHYNRYKDDVELMKWMGLDAYRFSISWSRILPTGRKSGGVNTEGVKYYKDLIQELDKNGITPFVTLFHWDVPQALEDEYGGFLNPKIINDFEDFADVCFMEFGNIVKHWITLNEPWSFSEGGYASGTLAPGRGDVSEYPTPKTKALRAPTKCSHICIEPAYSHGDPATEPYLVTHYQLLAHAHAAKLYKTKYQKHHQGFIGLALNSVWVEPNSEKDKEAQQRALDFTLNWFLEPITSGNYPKHVKTVIEKRKIRTIFSREESNMVKESIDFLGINYYTASYVRDASDVLIGKGQESYTTDAKVEYLSKCLLGDDWGAVDWLKVYPEGLKKLLKYVNQKYKGPIYITENGFGEKDVESLALHEALYDHKRVSYHHQHLRSMIEAINEYHIDVKGYFAWSLWDNFEWASGFSVRFGTIHVDYKNDLKRTPKFSAQWFKFILQKPRKKSSGLIDTSGRISLLAMTMTKANGYTRPEVDSDPTSFASNEDQTKSA